MDVMKGLLLNPLGVCVCVCVYVCTCTNSKCEPRFGVDPYLFIVPTELDAVGKCADNTTSSRGPSPLVVNPCLCCLMSTMYIVLLPAGRLAHCPA